ncbi:MAG: hypothetical protein ACU0FT_08055 [Paracoccus sp. (in: a-proteobacteria)]|uniref:hypothetical protein n=1 Tax=Paracoccus sp. TaxID=267 RepID=UPI004058DDC5
MTSWRDIAMRDIDWLAFLPILGPGVHTLRSLCEPPPRGRAWRKYTSGAWMDLTLGQVADLGREDLLRHRGIGNGTVAVLESVMDLAAAGHRITRPHKHERAG